MRILPSAIRQGPLALLLLCALQTDCLAAQWRCSTDSGTHFRAASDLTASYAGVHCEATLSHNRSAEDERAHTGAPILIPLSADSAPSTASNTTRSTEQQRCRRFDALVTHIALQNKQDPLLLHALIQQTSQYQTGYQAADGAVGMLRVLPALARRYGVINKQALSNAKTNLTVGAQHLAVLSTALQADLVQVLASYYAGLTVPNLPDPGTSTSVHGFVRDVVMRYLALHLRRSEVTDGQPMSACELINPP